MSERLLNHLGGRWVDGQGPGTALHDPVLGDELARADATGVDLAAGYAYAREVGGPALRALTPAARAGLLAQVGTLLQGRKAHYVALSTANSGTVASDTAVDIDGALYTLGQYARWGAKLDGAASGQRDGEAVSMAKDGSFQSQHLLRPVRGLALFINAFNFPAWGLWEKAAPALLAGVPVVVKPATATAWVTHAMVKDVVDAGLLPPGALSIVCGRSEGLLDALEPFDVLSFTGSADTAATLRRHAAVAERSVRINVEADSVNSALLLPGEAPGSAAFEALVKEVAREMTVKSGQKCTAIRRVLVPQALYGAVAEAVGARLRKTSVGNPRNETVRMGAVVNRAQFNTVHEGIDFLAAQAERLFDGRATPLVDADPAVACCVGPVLLGTRDAAGTDAADRVHRHEVFGPVATLLPYRDTAHALALARRGEGSLVASLYGSDDAELARCAEDLADSHGRVHVISPAAVATQTGHGNVMPQSLHGGPGRAGGGEELGGLRALAFYQRRSAIQAHPGVLGALSM